MLRRACAAVLVSVGFLAVPVQGVVIDLELSPEDFTHTSDYRNSGEISHYSESIAFSVPAGTVDPGEGVSVRLVFPQPVRMEDFYSGRHYRTDIALHHGSSVSGFNQSLSSTLTFLDATDLSIDINSGGGWLTDPTIVEHEKSAFLTPTDSFGQIGGVEWSYTAPSWTPAGTEMDMDFSLSFFTRAVAPNVVADPGRNLITFVPEPATALLILPAIALAARPRRRVTGG